MRSGAKGSVSDDAIANRPRLRSRKMPVSIHGETRAWHRVLVQLRALDTARRRQSAPGLTLEAVAENRRVFWWNHLLMVMAICYPRPHRFRRKLAAIHPLMKPVQGKVALGSESAQRGDEFFADIIM